LLTRRAAPELLTYSGVSSGLGKAFAEAALAHALKLVEDKMKEIKAEIAAWDDLSRSTNFEVVQERGIV